jgi:gliding motility associated protien GldN
MKTLVKVLCGAFLMIFTSEYSFSQQNVLGEGKPDGFYNDIHNPHRRVVPFAQVREADAMWQKRVWRLIDVREKINLQLYYPTSPTATRKSLWDVLNVKLQAGEIKAYSFNIIDMDDSWSLELTQKEIKGSVFSIDTNATDENGNHKAGGDTTKITSESIKDYELKEDWLFDKERSILDCRILGLCPRRAKINENTHAEDPSAAPVAMFWLYFPDLRGFLQTQPVFNTHNDAERRTLDDILMKRQFSSHIIQESNVYDRSIAAYYTNGLDALLEGERIHKDIAGIEHDMWQY